MTAPSLLDELEGVAGLADRLDRLSDAVAKQEWREFSMRVPAEPDRDADLVLARVARFIRTHHAEIAEAVKDKARMDWAEANAHALDWDPHDSMKRVIRGDDGTEFCGDTWREQIDNAMHNSAREACE